MKVLITSVVLFASCAAGSPALAQESAGDLSRVRTALLHEVRLTDDKGQMTSGVLQSVEKESFTVLTAQGPAATPAASVLRVERRGDSVKNGFVIGAFAGGGLTAAAVALSGEVNGSDIGGVAIAAVVWGLAGAGIDALHHGWTTVYRK